MRIAITGATGFIGSHLCKLLTDTGHKVLTVTRDKNKAIKILGEKIEAVEWSGISLNNIDAVINLAGENIGRGSWTNAKKEKILKSRIQSGHLITETIRLMSTRPKVLLQASAIGYYGDRADEILTENSSAGFGFLADVTKKWENSTKDVEILGIRRVLLRTAPVLSLTGGLLPQIIKPFKYFVGFDAGKKDQWMSWIHIEDEINAIKFLLESDKATGPYNLSSPTPVIAKAFYRTLAKRLGRPCWPSPPSFVLRMLLGDKADELIFSSARVLPHRLLAEGYKFKFQNIDNAFKNILEETI